MGDARLLGWRARRRACTVRPYGNLQGDILTQFEIGHFTPCTFLSDPAQLTIGTFTDTFFQTCNGPYETSGDSAGLEGSDAPCFPVGDTHGGQPHPTR